MVVEGDYNMFLWILDLVGGNLIGDVLVVCYEGIVVNEDYYWEFLVLSLNWWGVDIEREVVFGEKGRGYVEFL